MERYAPILMTTLNRCSHLRRSVESLLRCKGSDKTELFIGVDYPPTESYFKGYDEVCEYARSIEGFKQVHVYIRERNYGQFLNTKMLRDEAKALGFESFILSEDDNEYSENFLEYMNQALVSFRDDNSVCCICSHTYQEWKSFDGYDRNAFAIQGFCAWGVGNWFDKVDEYYAYPEPGELISSWKTAFRLFRLGQHVTIHRIISRISAGKEVGGDVKRRIYMVLNGKYAVFPKVNKVRNIGFDGSGEHCAMISSYSLQSIDEDKDFSLDSIEVRDYGFARRFYRQQYTGGAFTRVSAVVEYVMYKLTGKGFRSFSLLTSLMRSRLK